MDILHTCLWVSDLERTKEFYIDALGLEHTWDFERDGVTNFYVAGTGDSEAEIQFKYDPADDGEVEPAGVDHVAVTVADTDAEVERLLEETETELTAGPMDADAAGSRIAFITDPDGYGVELIGPLD